MIQGILLAAGEGRRFQARQPAAQPADKLLAILPATNKTVLATSAHSLQQVLPDCLAVIQPHQLARQACLEAAGVPVTHCEQAANGMGHALAHTVSQSQTAGGWLVMLADMPWISRALVVQLCEQLTQADQIIVPVYRGQRGHPVLFGAHWCDALMSLNGDHGAKALIQAHANKLIKVECSDDSILRDVDVVADLNHKC